MRAWFTIAAKEWLDVRRDKRLRLLAALVLVLMLCALAFGADKAHRQSHAHAAASLTDRLIWESQGAKDPHAAAHFGQYVFTQTGPLALADPGVQPYTGSALWLEAHRQNELQFSAARDAGLSARFASLSLAFMVQTVLPLVVILLGFAAFSGERERGTLTQLMGLGCRSVTLLAGKGLGLVVQLAVLLAPVCLIVVVTVFWAGEGASTPVGNSLLRLALAVLGYALYLGGFVALTLAASAWFRHSRVALVVLLAFWLLNCFVASRVASDLAQAQTPLPSAQMFRSAVAQDKRKTFGHDPQHPAYIAFQAEVLQTYGVQRLEDLPVNFRGLLPRRDDENGYRIFDKHVAALREGLNQQDRQRALAGPLFPMLALQPFSMGLAGTDNAHQFHFATAAEAHRRLIQNMVSDDLTHNSRYGDKTYRADAQLWARIPEMAYQMPGAAWALKAQAQNLLSLLAWCVAASVLAVVAAHRMRPL
ncbi:MAG: DUF3526 domain-containing protein [Burkholderiales bacterium]